MSKDRQFDLEDPASGARLTCWLEDDARLRVGVRLTLKQTGTRLWRIVKRYTHVVDDADLKRHWKVGGLK